MPGKPFTPEQTIGKLREAEVESAKGATVVQVCRKLGITDQTHCRRRAEHGGMRSDQATQLKELETEKARTKKLAPGLGGPRPHQVVASLGQGPLCRGRTLLRAFGRNPHALRAW